LTPSFRFNQTLVVLTEYVTNDYHQSVCDTFIACGLAGQLCTSPRKGHNQVFIAARTALEPGTLSPPPSLPHATSNFLHIRCDGSPLEVLGLRVPDNKSAKDKREWWDWFERTISPLLHRQTIAIGDFNIDPSRPHTIGAHHLRRLQALGWHLPTPDGDWSFISVRGCSSRIDHALVSPSIRVLNARYIINANGYAFAGPGSNYLSDHAPLVIEADHMAI
jgi:exonuclease III